MTQNNKKGFTIIEVVLVLAIAGLIFLVVFLALPALQKGQRDTQRKNDLSRFMSQLANYQSNNQGNVPAATSTAVTDFVTRYLTPNGESFSDPTTGALYTVTAQTTLANLPSSNGDIYYYAGARCNGEAAPSAGTARQVAVAIKLERGTLLCQQN